jgi:hypothetical protein
MTGAGDQTKPISLFYSYSHRDEELRERLEEHLASLRWSGMISEWHDRNINVGADWEKEINSHLLSADIILLLVSASFIASKYCWSVEVKTALERHERGEARVVPVILRPCRWCIAPFAKLQAAPKDGKAVTDWSNLDSAFDDVASSIERVVRELRRAEEEAQRKAAEEERQLAEARRRPEEQEARPKAEEKRQPVEAEEQEEEHRRAEQEEARRKAGKRQRAGAQRKAQKVPALGEKPKSVCTRCGGTGEYLQSYSGSGMGTIFLSVKCHVCGGTGK